MDRIIGFEKEEFGSLGGWWNPSANSSTGNRRMCALALEPVLRGWPLATSWLITRKSRHARDTLSNISGVE